MDRHRDFLSWTDVISTNFISTGRLAKYLYYNELDHNTSSIHNFKEE